MRAEKVGVVKMGDAEKNDVNVKNVNGKNAKLSGEPLLIRFLQSWPLVTLGSTLLGLALSSAASSFSAENKSVKSSTQLSQLESLAVQELYSSQTSTKTLVSRKLQAKDPSSSTELSEPQNEKIGSQIKSKENSYSSSEGRTLAPQATGIDPQIFLQVQDEDTEEAIKAYRYRLGLSGTLMRPHDTLDERDGLGPKLQAKLNELGPLPALLFQLGVEKGFLLQQKVPLRASVHAEVGLSQSQVAVRTPSGNIQSAQLTGTRWGLSPAVLTPLVRGRNSSSVFDSKWWMGGQFYLGEQAWILGGESSLTRGSQRSGLLGLSALLEYKLGNQRTTYSQAQSTSALASNLDSQTYVQVGAGWMESRLARDGKGYGDTDLKLGVHTSW